MSLKKYLLIMTSATLLSWVAWLVVLFYINPDDSGMVGYSLFYISLLVALVGTFSLVGFFGRVWFSREQVIFRHLGVSTRQSVWFSVLLVGSLLLQGTGYLKWWSLLFFIMLLTLLEFFFISRKVIHRQ
ncbi:MAG: hypothetical protein PHY34_03280 [Patescibacteria group bacterium]|nr:hypothetical protein [Patescibacteria group bacterium]MDD5716103.1 hypothetical protein [Patescibacteria group bacterium]